METGFLFTAEIERKALIEIVTIFYRLQPFIHVFAIKLCILKGNLWALSFIIN